MGGSSSRTQTSSPLQSPWAQLWSFFFSQWLNLTSDLEESQANREIEREAKLKLNIIFFCAALGTALTHRRTSRTTRTGSKRRSTCCSAVRPSRRESEASKEEDVDAEGGFVIFIFCNLCSERLSCTEKFLTKFLLFVSHEWRGRLLCNVWTLMVFDSLYSEFFFFQYAN